MSIFEKIFESKKSEKGGQITLNLHEGGFDFDTFYPWRYYWDDFGIEATTYEHETIHDIVIFFGKLKLDSGTLKQ